MYDDCKIYSVTEDYSIALAFIPGTAGGSSRYELRVISDEDFSRGVSVGSVGSKEYRYLGKTSGVDVYYGDFTFDGIPDIARIQDTELSLRVIISSINDLEEETYLWVGYPSAIHNKSLYPELMTENYYITFDDIRFCIVNGRRGIRVMTLGELELKGEVTKKDLEKEAERAEIKFEYQPEKMRTVRIGDDVYKLTEQEYNKFLYDLKNMVEEDLESNLAEIDEKEALKLLYTYKEMQENQEFLWQQ